MSFREKSAAATLAVLVLVYGGYFWRLGDWRDLPPMAAVDGMLIGTVVGLIVLLIFVHIVIAVLSTLTGQKAEEDERDRLIELIGDRNGGYALGAGAFITILGLLWGAAPVQAVHMLLLSMVLGEVVKLTSQLVLYRRGV